MGEIEFNEEGQFNQASFQQRRLNDLMSLINFYWINPTIFNEELSDYNYKIIFRSLTSYYSEIRPKLTTQERDDIDAKEKQLHEYIERFPIIISVKHSSFYSTSSHVKFQTKEWNVIKECLLAYQNKILEYADKHKLGNPSRENPEHEITN